MTQAAKRVLWVGFVAGAQVLVLAVAVDPGGLRAFTSLRWFLISSLTAAAILVGGTGSLPRWVNWCWLFLVGAMVVAALAGVDPTTSWIGLPQRQLGVLAWVVFALATHQGASLGPGGLVILARASLAAALIGGAVVVAQVAGWHPFGVDFAGNRFGGLLGQPIIQGAVAVLLLPLVATATAPLALRAVGVLSVLAMIYTSQSRGAVVGLLALVLISIPTWWPAVRGAWADKGGNASLVSAGLGLAAVAVLGGLAFSPIGGRLADAPASSRIDEWSLAARVLAESPFLGVGPEGYRIAVLDQIDTEYAETYGREVQVDRAHSAPLDVALAGGVPAGVAYLALLVGLAVRVWRSQRQPSLATAAGVGAIAYFATTLVAFPTPPTDTVAWLFAGTVLALGPSSVNFGRNAVRAAAALVFVVAAAAGATDVIADHHMADADDLIATGHQPDAVAAADSATDLRPDMIDTWYVAAKTAAAGPSILDLDAGLDRVEAGLNRFPDDPALVQLHAELLVDRAIRSEQAADVQRAENALADLGRRDSTNSFVEFGTQSLAQACLPRCDKTP